MTGEVAVPLDDLDDFMNIPNHTLVFHKAPTPEVLSKADAATTIQCSARGFLIRALGRRRQAAAVILQRHARGILVRALGRRRHAAAITIQRHARGTAIRHCRFIGFEVRWHVKRLRAAIRIQRIYRGHKARCTEPSKVL